MYAYCACTYIVSQIRLQNQYTMSQFYLLQKWLYRLWDITPNMGHGKYFKSNALKVLIMNTLFFSDLPMTAREIAEKIGVPHVNVSKQLCMYQRKHCGYFRRLKPIQGKAFRYKISEKGEKYFFVYCRRIYYGYDLNLRATTPQRMPKYYIMKQQRLDAALRRIEEPKLEDIIDLAPEDIEQYIGLTRRGSLEMGLTAADLKISSSAL